MLAHISGEELRRIVHKKLLVKALVTDLVRQECLACAFACIYFPALDSVWKAWWLKLTQKTKITHLFCHSFPTHTWQMSMNVKVWVVPGGCGNRR